MKRLFLAAATTLVVICGSQAAVASAATTHCANVYSRVADPSVDLTINEHSQQQVISLTVNNRMRIYAGACGKSKLVTSAARTIELPSETINYQAKPSDHICRRIVSKQPLIVGRHLRRDRYGLWHDTLKIRNRIVIQIRRSSDCNPSRPTGTLLAQRVAERRFSEEFTYR